jgi:uncharacterized OB-fold protein
MTDEAGAVEVVKSIRTPIHLDYGYTPGVAQSKFLRQVARGRLMGQRCPSCAKVYLPPRGACPTCGVATDEEVECANTGTVTTFCVVNVPFSGQKMDLPYVSAHIVLDGADTTLMGLVQEIPAKDVRMGLRVEAVWADESDWQPTLANIKWFRPSGEPDADYDTYKEHL